MALDPPSTPKVEATSLTSVLHLAANPPPQPTRCPPGTPGLVLYIARVPGSRDVFLTPLKPRDKVVTAADVQSSLYYLHYHNSNNQPPEADYRSGNPPPPRPSSVNTDAGNLPTISDLRPPSPKRKAVPPTLPRRPDVQPTYLLDENDKPPVLPPRPGSVRKTVHRKPLLPNRSTSRDGGQGVHMPTLPPRPLPPTPPLEPENEAEEEKDDRLEPSLHQENLHLLRRESHLDPSKDPYQRHYLPSNHLNSPAPSLFPSSNGDTSTATSLTLIRRHPGTNEQWNVATIYDPPSQETGSSSSPSLLLPRSAKNRTKRGGADLWIEVLGEGYAQFVRSPPHHKTNDSSDRLNQNAESRTSVSTASSSSPRCSGEISNSDLSSGTFRRKVYLPTSGFVEQQQQRFAPTHRKFGSASAANGESAMSMLRRKDRHSVDFASLHDHEGTSANGDGNGNVNAVLRTAGKGYTFASPWEGGRCEFSTGARGTSLKCRHFLPPEPATYPAAAAPGKREAVVVVEEVSELRFNLPTSAKSPSSASLSPRFSYFAPRLRPEEDENSEDEDEGRIDLSLGRERAGGGFGGKRAKLGKLIVEPAGLGMLDLLVAANLGLWWRAWERV